MTPENSSYDRFKLDVAALSGLLEYRDTKS